MQYHQKTTKLCIFFSKNNEAEIMKLAKFISLITIFKAFSLTLLITPISASSFECKKGQNFQHNIQYFCILYNENYFITLDFSIIFLNWEFYFFLSLYTVSFCAVVGWGAFAFCIFKLRRTCNLTLFAWLSTFSCKLSNLEFRDNINVCSSVDLNNRQQYAHICKKG